MKRIFLIIITSLLLFSCNEDLLELTPQDRISEASVWEDQNLIQAYVNSQYHALLDGLNADNATQYYSDEAYSQFNHVLSWSFGDGSISQDNVASLSTSLNYWTTAYSYLRNINVFFKQIEQAPVTADAKTTMVAEMKFIRAFIYSNLIKNYGGVPIIDKVFSLEEDLTGITRNSYQEVLNYIINDLDACISALPAKQIGANAGRACGDAAKALKSRVLLYDASSFNNPSNDQAKWQAASNAAEVLLNAGYSLYPNYGQLFLVDGNSEVIFQMYHNPENGSFFNHRSAPPGSGGYGHYAPSQNLVDDYEMANGQLPLLDDGTINPASGFDPDNPYENRDSRFYDVVLYNGALFGNRTLEIYPGGIDYVGNDASPTGYHNNKFMNQSVLIANVSTYSTPWIYFRLAEIYLNYAEAQFMLGNEDVAREYVNKIRQRANMPEITESGNALMVKIQHERRIELVYEGHRFYDVRRWKIAPQTEIIPIIGTKITKVSDGEYSYEQTTLLPKVWDNKYYLIPIPYTEIQKSEGSLVQNPGY